MCLKDNPTVSTTKHRRHKETKKYYREDRHQSPFVLEPSTWGIDTLFSSTKTECYFTVCPAPYDEKCKHTPSHHHKELEKTANTYGHIEIITPGNFIAI